MCWYINDMWEMNEYFVFGVMRGKLCPIGLYFPPLVELLLQRLHFVVEPPSDVYKERMFIIHTQQIFPSLLKSYLQQPLPLFLYVCSLPFRPSFWSQLVDILLFAKPSLQSVCTLFLLVSFYHLVIDAAYKILNYSLRLLCCEIKNILFKDLAAMDECQDRIIVSP